MQQTVALPGTQTQRMNRLLLWPATLALLISAGGCLSLPSQKAQDTLFDRDGIDAVLAASDRQAMILKEGNSKGWVCLAPGPDFSVTASRGVDFGVDLGLPIGPKTKENIGADVSRGALSLGGRNPEVLIARALMYRACELTMNLEADKATAIQIYTRFLQAIENIAKMQTGSGTASVSAVPLDPRLQPPPSPAPPSTPGGASPGDSGSSGFTPGGSGSFGMPPVSPGGSSFSTPGGFPPGDSGSSGFPPGGSGFPPGDPGSSGMPPVPPSSPGGFPPGDPGSPGMPPPVPPGGSSTTKP